MRRICQRSANEDTTHSDSKLGHVQPPLPALNPTISNRKTWQDDETSGSYTQLY
jgi:hypothetical protein